MDKNDIINAMKDNHLNDDKFYISPNIPHDKILNAINSHEIAAYCKPKDIIFLADDTLFGSAKDGLILTEKYISYKGKFQDPFMVELEYIKSVRVDGNSIYIDNEKMTLNMPDKSSITALYYVLREIIDNKESSLDVDDEEMDLGVDDEVLDIYNKYGVSIIDGSTIIKQLSDSYNKEISEARRLEFDDTVFDTKTHKKLLKHVKSIIDNSLLYKERFIKSFPNIDFDYKCYLGNITFVVLNLAFLITRYLKIAGEGTESNFVIIKVLTDVYEQIEDRIDIDLDTFMDGVVELSKIADRDDFSAYAFCYQIALTQSLENLFSSKYERSTLILQENNNLDDEDIREFTTGFAQDIACYLLGNILED